MMFFVKISKRMRYKKIAVTICYSYLHYFLKKISTLHDVQDAYLWRRKRDLNPRDTFAPYSLSRGAPSPLGYFSSLWRRGWDSNPRALSDKRFSRPPRYDHFDTSPNLRLTSKYILTNR